MSPDKPTSTGSIRDRQRRLAEEFELFDSWEERYALLADLGRRLPAMPAALRIDQNRVPECRSDTFLAGEHRGGRLYLYASSDAPTLAGILAIFVDLYSGEPPSAILGHPPALLDRIGLTQRLSPHRRIALLRIHERLVGIATGMETPRRLAS